MTLRLRAQRRCKGNNYILLKNINRQILLHLIRTRFFNWKTHAASIIMWSAQNREVLRRRRNVGMKKVHVV